MTDFAAILRGLCSLSETVLILARAVDVLVDKVDALGNGKPLEIRPVLSVVPPVADDAPLNIAEQFAAKREEKKLAKLLRKRPLSHGKRTHRWRFEKKRPSPYTVLNSFDLHYIAADLADCVLYRSADGMDGGSYGYNDSFSESALSEQLTEHYWERWASNGGSKTKNFHPLLSYHGSPFAHYCKKHGAHIQRDSINSNCWEIRWGTSLNAIAARWVRLVLDGVSYAKDIIPTLRASLEDIGMDSVTFPERWEYSDDEIADDPAGLAARGGKLTAYEEMREEHYREQAEREEIEREVELDAQAARDREDDDAHCEYEQAAGSLDDDCPF